MDLAIEIVAVVCLAAALPAVAFLARRMSKGQAAGAMMAIGFVFASMFQARAPQTTEETIKRRNETSAHKKSEDNI